MKKKNNILNILISTVIFSLIGVIVYANPSQGPIDGNISIPITQLANSQVKNGSLSVNKFLVGSLSGNGFAVFNSNGKLGINMVKTGTDVNNPTEALDVNGSIGLSDLTSQGAELCVNSSGDIAQCGSYIFTHDGDGRYPYETFYFTVPLADSVPDYKAAADSRVIINKVARA